jgi:hypothetical protein
VPDLAVYTTVYPGVERFLADWFASVVRQTDHRFRLWIGLDVLSVDEARRAMGRDPDAVWIVGEAGDTPASLRSRALADLVRQHPAVVLVDSDDVLHASRVASAREALSECDVAGCALRLIGDRGDDLGASFSLPAGALPDAVFPRTNVYGMSNTAWKSEMLLRCLPVPRDAVMVDWHLATRAWLFGARFAFSRRAEMDYRQYGTNTARVLGPFTGVQVAEDADRVRAHYRLVLSSDLDGADQSRLRRVEDAAADVELFHERVVERPAALSSYVDALNASPPDTVWWAWVAHPSLRRLWKPEEGAA